MSMLFKFRPLVINPELAEAIGLNEAIVLQQLHYWISETASGVEHDGRRWVYNTQQQWRDQFPFWSVDTIKRTFSSLQGKGLIRVDQLNKSRHDRTNFYTLEYKQIALLDKHESAPFDQCNLPSSIGANSAVLLTETTTETTTETVRASEQQDLFDRFWKLYPRKQDKAKARKAWEKLKVGEDLFNLIAKGLAAQAASHDWTKDGGRYVPMPTTWLNGRRWDDEVIAGPAKPQSRHHGFDERDYYAGLTEREDGTHAF